MHLVRGSSIRAACVRLAVAGIVGACADPLTGPLFGSWGGFGISIQISAGDAQFGFPCMLVRVPGKVLSDTGDFSVLGTTNSSLNYPATAVRLIGVAARESITVRVAYLDTLAPASEAFVAYRDSVTRPAGWLCTE